MVKTCVTGDLHGAFPCLMDCFQQCPEATHLLVAGDFGFFPNDTKWKPDFSIFNRLPPVSFIDGNHDDVPHLYEFGAQPWPATWLPRGSLYTDGLGRSWLCMGGADSVDRTLRQRYGGHWAPQESITEDQIAQALETARVKGDIYGVISHTAPQAFCLPGIDDRSPEEMHKFFTNRGWDLDERLTASRVQLDILLKVLAPKEWIFSHFHIAAEGDDRGCRWHCLLNADHEDGPKRTWLCLERLGCEATTEHSSIEPKRSVMGQKTYIYFDTEFTSFDAPELLSLGAVSHDGQEFYAEITPIPLEACSDFAKSHVLPKFTGPEFSREQVASRFLAWLGSFGTDITLLSDSTYDRDLINGLCGGYPLQIPGGHKCYWMPLPGKVDNNPHHALEDAKGLWQAFVAQFVD